MCLAIIVALVAVVLLVSRNDSSSQGQAVEHACDVAATIGFFQDDDLERSPATLGYLGSDPVEGASAEASSACAFDGPPAGSRDGSVVLVATYRFKSATEASEGLQRCEERASDGAASRIRGGRIAVMSRFTAIEHDVDDMAVAGHLNQIKIICARSDRYVVWLQSSRASDTASTEGDLTEPGALGDAAGSVASSMVDQPTITVQDDE